MNLLSCLKHAKKQGFNFCQDHSEYNRQPIKSMIDRINQDGPDKMESDYRVTFNNRIVNKDYPEDYYYLS